MKLLSILRQTVIMAMLALILTPAAHADSAYQAALPADLNTNPDLCALLQVCQEVLQGRPLFLNAKAVPFMSRDTPKQTANAS